MKCETGTCVCCKNKYCQRPMTKDQKDNVTTVKSTKEDLKKGAQ